MCSLGDMRLTRGNHGAHMELSEGKHLETSAEMGCLGSAAGMAAFGARGVGLIYDSGGPSLGGMNPARFLRLCTVLVLAGLPLAAAPQLPGVGAAMQEMIAKNEMAGAVTLVVSKDKTLHQ